MPFFSVSLLQLRFISIPLLLVVIVARKHICATAPTTSTPTTSTTNAPICDIDTEPLECDDAECVCRDGSKIPKTFLCNGFFECPDESDEFHEGCLPRCMDINPVADCDSMPDFSPKSCNLCSGINTWTADSLVGKNEDYSEDMCEKMCSGGQSVKGRILCPNTFRVNIESSTSSTESTSTATPTESTSTATPTESTSTATPTESTSTATPTESTSTATPTESTSTATPTESTSTATPTQSTSTATPTESTSTATPTESTSTATPTESTSTATPTESTSTATPTESTSTATPTESTSTATPTESTSTATPTESTPTATPTESTSTATPTESTSTATPTESTSTATPTESTSTTTPYAPYTRVIIWDQNEPTTTGKWVFQIGGLYLNQKHGCGSDKDSCSGSC